MCLMLVYVFFVLHIYIPHKTFEIDICFAPVVAKNDELSTVCLGVLATHGMVLISIGYFMCITLSMQVLV